MIVLLLCWFLFVFPLQLLAAGLLGAFIYHSGKAGMAPTLSMPRFGLSRRTDAPERAPAGRLPAV